MNAIAALALWALLSPFALLGTDSGGPLKTYLPSSVTLGAPVRYRAESTSRSYLLERYRLDVELRPAAWLGPHPDAGSERVIGAGEWGNTAHAFDAVRVAIHHVVNRTDPSDHHRQGNNLLGLYGSFGSWLASAAGRHDLELRVQRHRGSAATAQRKRHFRDRRWQPTLLGEANYASTHLDPLYPTHHGVYGIAGQIGRRNTKSPRAGVYACNGVLVRQPGSAVRTPVSGTVSSGARRRQKQDVLRHVRRVSPVD
ncbi:MAG: hypothetical protein INH43_15620 [Acidobacteriaceae bacterium]|jgi:hypothetical protein|nr:hypothetical protein [Acidobacteriaceae bacterium]